MRRRVLPSGPWRRTSPAAVGWAVLLGLVIGAAPLAAQQASPAAATPPLITAAPEPAGAALDAATGLAASRGTRGGADSSGSTTIQARSICPMPVFGAPGGGTLRTFRPDPDIHYHIRTFPPACDNPLASSGVVAGGRGSEPLVPGSLTPGRPLRLEELPPGQAAQWQKGLQLEPTVVTSRKPGG